ncbi:MAG: PorT family protein [Niabella sp.]|nr:PorT family protein [Niabella sp.]
MIKKSLFFVMLFAMTGTAFAQVSFGVRAGVNFSNALSKDANGNKYATSLLPGFNAGVTAEIPIADEFSVQPGLLFSTKGAKRKETQSGMAITANIAPNYLELPVNFLFKPALGKGNLLLGAGPYIAYGMGGNWKVKGSSGNTTVSRSGNLDFKNDISSADSSNLNASTVKTLTYGKPLDLGVNLLLGYAFSKNISFQLNGQLGLLNTVPTVQGNKTGEVQKNVQFGLSVGYKF